MALVGRLTGLVSFSFLLTNRMRNGIGLHEAKNAPGHWSFTPAIFIIVLIFQRFGI